MRLPALLCSLLIALVPTSEAATVFRCTAADGGVLFSQYGCPVERRQEIQQADNPTPGGSESVPMATPRAPAAAKAASARSKGKEIEQEAVVVVGEQQNGCGNRVTGSARRKAIIEGRIRTGMTRSDVESALGRPDRTSQHNDTLRYHYEADKKHGARTVTFDEDGCVMGKAKR
ncbi:outer membrane protein assembly factor BamE [Pseudomonas sp. CAN2814]|uniref:outer membrane protein assembly factor BamE domain-containing protein n=1 Tax=Pseudomonas sp. CAN1 TaxID=3046726 RepID=UPI002649FD16|nr:outer membrane protein assembly factor BamE [Pseudomonas sp. CAN1]MDN6858016.1 outer membrane protein assembly factor BamE [Pseudomonas sp. CAN1]